ncbi:MAG: iron-sulfur cluster-binding protein [Rhodospirillaceae bacterium]|nr:iron-sulfur cluster-binding protein [Rhodospirillaceae bacterium]
MNNPPPPFTHDHPTSHSFDANARTALADENLQTQLAQITRKGFQQKRKAAMERLPEFDQLRDQARDLKSHTLDHLDVYLERFEAKVIEAGGQVHWASDAAEAREIILKICNDVDAKTVTKGKSMITEEIGLNGYLEQHGIRPVETDLGEYIIQLRGEPPSHIIAPAFHISKEQVEAEFRKHHTELDAARDISEPKALLNEARNMLRREFISADVGITGANMLIAETGTALIVTNEGNGDLTQSLPPVHIAVTSIEKVIPTLEDASLLLRLLARSATGQETTVYTTFFTGPKRADDVDGPEQFHIVLLDNGRSKILGGEFHDVLRCIRCGSCMNHCPVFGAVGGHAYGWVYPGPIGSVLTPLMVGIDEAYLLADASTFCGRCEAVCPVRIPLPKMLHRHRVVAYEAGHGSLLARVALKMWATIAVRPAIYHRLASFKLGAWKMLAGKRGRFKSFPFASGWTASRDLPTPEGKTFQALWKARNGKVK